MATLSCYSVLARLLIAPALFGAFELAAAQGQPSAPPERKTGTVAGETTQDYNERLQQLKAIFGNPAGHPARQGYRIGPGDLLEIAVFEAPELGRTLRVAESGDISLPLLGSVRAAGLTPREEESVLEELLRRTYMKDPHVSVFVKEMESHSVSVLGAVRRPGVFQIRETKTLIELLSMAEGLADDAGDTVQVVHQTFSGVATQALDSRQDASSGAGPAKQRPGPNVNLPRAASAGEVPPRAAIEEISLKALLESSDSRWNVLVYPGDAVKVSRAGIVYVVGEIRKPGGFQLKNNETISVLQAISLAEGLTRTSAASRARIIRTDEATGKRIEIPIHLAKILAGKIPDPSLKPRDILFVPNSAGRSALYRSMEAAVTVGTGLTTGLLIYR